MAKLSKADAAKAAGVSRQTLYTFLKDGRISADADGLIDTAELLRAGFTLHDFGRQEALHSGHPLTSNSETVDINRELIAMLKQQLDAALIREQEAREREQHQREELTWLRHQFEQMQLRYDRLLEAGAKPSLPAGKQGWWARLWRRR
jgi:hypothetical protein